MSDLPKESKYFLGKVEINEMLSSTHVVCRPGNIYDLLYITEKSYFIT